MTTLEPRTNLRPNLGISLPQFGSTPASESRAPSEPLTEAVRTAVRGVAEMSLRPVARRDAGLAYQPRALLALLTYCYVRGVYGSAEIERLMQKDVHFRKLCGGEFPRAQTLRCFRRENRVALESCLAAALRLLEPVAGRECVNAEQMAEEALHRIGMAMFMDSMDMEV